MTWEWCITEDWKTPAKGEEWHDAGSYEAACEAGLEQGAGRYTRYVQTPNGIVIDFGSHSRFVLVRKKGGAE